MVTSPMALQLLLKGKGAGKGGAGPNHQVAGQIAGQAVVQERMAGQAVVQERKGLRNPGVVFRGG